MNPSNEALFNRVFDPIWRSHSHAGCSVVAQRFLRASLKLQGPWVSLSTDAYSSSSQARFRAATRSLQFSASSRDG